MGIERGAKHSEIPSNVGYFPLGAGAAINKDAKCTIF